MNETRLIPRTIHYFWFGTKQKSELIESCIDSWKRYSPGYEIIEWNEDSFDVYSSRYSAQAYESGKYAFVSDFARLKVLYEYGGFYLDTDVELLKCLDELRNQEAFMGFEPGNLVSPGCIIGAQPQNEFIGEMLDMYQSLSFKYNDHFNVTTIGEYATALLLKKGLKLNGQYQRLPGINIYPVEAFCPRDHNTGALNITDGTYSIHHFDGSWKENKKIENNAKVNPIKQRVKLWLLSAAGERNFFRMKYLLR